MRDDELISIFRSELHVDIPRFKGLLDEESVKDIKAFAHKYKVRLEYLGFFNCYELCLDIECHFKEGEESRLLEAAGRLLEGLRAIQNE